MVIGKFVAEATRAIEQIFFSKLQIIYTVDGEYQFAVEKCL
jgi:hypothetical protein